MKLLSKLVGHLDIGARVSLAFTIVSVLAFLTLPFMGTGCSGASTTVVSDTVNSNAEMFIYADEVHEDIKVFITDPLVWDLLSEDTKQKLVEAEEKYQQAKSLFNSDGTLEASGLELLTQVAETVLDAMESSVLEKYSTEIAVTRIALKIVKRRVEKLLAAATSESSGEGDSEAVDDQAETSTE